MDGFCRPGAPRWAPTLSLSRASDSVQCVCYDAGPFAVLVGGLQVAGLCRLTVCSVTSRSPTSLETWPLAVHLRQPAAPAPRSLWGQPPAWQDKGTGRQLRSLFARYRLRLDLQGVDLVFAVEEAMYRMKSVG